MVLISSNSYIILAYGLIIRNLLKFLFMRTVYPLRATVEINHLNKVNIAEFLGLNLNLRLLVKLKEIHYHLIQVFLPNTHLIRRPFNFSFLLLFYFSFLVQDLCSCTFVLFLIIYLFIYFFL